MGLKWCTGFETREVNYMHVIILSLFYVKRNWNPLFLPLENS